MSTNEKNTGYTAPKEHFIYRVKFTKEEQVKFIGHLDIMRLFQRAIRRAGLPVAYSKGFNPHQLLSFASPLTLGMTSQGEYGDFEMTEKIQESILKERLNCVLPEGIKIKGSVLLPTGCGSAMANVAAAAYCVTLDRAFEKEEIKRYLSQKEILVMKKTKKNLKETDIRADILKLEQRSDTTLFMLLSAGSKRNLKPELVVKSLYEYKNIAYDGFKIRYERQEIYQLEKDTLIPLSGVSEDRYEMECGK